MKSNLAKVISFRAAPETDAQRKEREETEKRRLAAFIAALLVGLKRLHAATDRAALQALALLRNAETELSMLIYQAEQGGARKLEGALLARVSDFESSFNGLMKREIEAQYVGAGNALDGAISAVGLNPTLTIASGRDLIAEQKFIADLSKGLITDLEKIVESYAAAVGNGALTGPQIAAGVETALLPIRARVQTQVITETARAGSLGLNARANENKPALLAQSYRLGKTWNTMNDDRVRDDHVDAGDDYAFPIDHDAYFVVGGEQCQFPRDWTLSPEQSCNCRCFALPALIQVAPEVPR
jgi:hypothetical protein